MFTEDRPLLGSDPSADKLYRLSAVAMSLLPRQDQIRAEKEHTATLTSHGFNKEQIKTIAALSPGPLLQLCRHMKRKSCKAEIHLLLTALARARLSSGHLHQLQEIMLSLCGHTDLPDPDQLSRLLRKWAKADESILATDILTHLIENGVYVKNGGWEAYLKKHMQKPSEFSCLVDMKAVDHGVRIIPLTSGKAILQEGRNMGHFLSDAGQAYRYFMKCENYYTRIFHLEVQGNPKLCATLCISNHGPCNWYIDDFNTAGNGEPPELLQVAAMYVLDTHNNSYCEEMDLSEGNYEEEAS